MLFRVLKIPHSKVRYQISSSEYIYFMKTKKCLVFHSLVNKRIDFSARCRTFRFRREGRGEVENFKLQFAQVINPISSQAADFFPPNVPRLKIKTRISHLNIVVEQLLLHAFRCHHRDEYFLIFVRIFARFPEIYLLHTVFEIESISTANHRTNLSSCFCAVR